jgi:hypothetical protein
VLLLLEMKKLVEEEAPGPHPSFSLVHALYAILILGEQSVGRQRLAGRLSIGEGAVRTLLRKLTRRGFVVTDRAGCHLTPKGAFLCEEAEKAFYLFEPRSSGLPGKASFGVGVRGGGRIARGIPERDQAIKAGADGALVLTCKGRELYMPGLSNVSREHPELSKSILETVAPSDGDAVIVSWGDDVSGVVYGSLNAAWSLYERLSSKG